MSYFATPANSQAGDVTVYIALIMLGVMLSGALLLSTILMTQLRSTEDIVESERAFYAANTGVERAFYELSLFATPDLISLNDTVPYDTDGPQAAYDARARYTADGLTPCINVVGASPVKPGQSYPGNAPQAQERRLSAGPSDCLPE